MKLRPVLCITLLACGVSAYAQSQDNTRPLFDFRKKKVDDATREKAVDAAKAAIKSVPADVRKKAEDFLIAPETAEMRQQALKAAQTIMRSQDQNSGTTTPQPTTPAPAVMPDAVTPVPRSPATPVVETPPPPSGPQPQPLQPLNLDEAPQATKGQIVITAQKSAFFDANRGYGTYVGDVKARHPQMYIECEELEIHMAKREGGLLESKPKALTNTKDTDILAAPTKKKGADAPPIERADARGPMVTVEKISETGELQIGHCKHLIYDGKTGNTTLLEWPQVHAGNKLHKATEPGCVMIIDQKGMLTTKGAHETIILQGENATPRSRGGIAPSGQR